LFASGFAAPVIVTGAVSLGQGLPQLPLGARYKWPLFDLNFVSSAIAADGQDQKPISKSLKNLNS
jgi:hypothetical protein